MSTIEELREALAAPHDSMIFIESIMDRYDVPELMIGNGRAMANLDYGPRGPQHRAGMQI